MKDNVQKVYDDVEEFLKDSIEHQNKRIDYILINTNNDDLWVMCSDGIDTAIEFHYRDGMMKNNYVPEWDFNFDYYAFNLLEDGFKIEYMSNDFHCSLWNSIHELYQDDIEFENRVKNYIRYCKNNNINKKYLDEKTGLNTPDVMKKFQNIDNVVLCCNEEEKMNDMQVKAIRDMFPKGTRIQLLYMEDNYPVPKGTKGSVDYIDDDGQIHMNWDNGESLALIYGVDKFNKIDERKIEKER